jgi:CRISPR-associated protein Cas1
LKLITYAIILSITAIGQKNHYNVKLLKGYGVSINLRDNKICLKGGTNPFTGEQETEGWFVTQIPYERIVISGRGYLSTEDVKLLIEILKVPISIVSSEGDF